MIAEPTGTDGFPVLCHQFFISSLVRLAYCINRSSTCEASEESVEGSPPPAVNKQRRPGPKRPADALSASEWPTVLQRVVEQKEPLRTVATAFGVSPETIRRILLHVQKRRGQQEVYSFPSSRPHSLLHIASKQANRHLFLLSFFHSSCKSIYSISSLTPLFLLFSSRSFFLTL
jgi:hypothetical protein